MAGIAIRDKIIADCLTAIAVNDNSRVNSVTFGRYRGDPVVDRNWVAVLPGNYDLQASRSGITLLDEYQGDMDLELPGRQIAGLEAGQFWYLHGVIELGCNLVKLQLELEDASDLAFRVLGRVQLSAAGTQFTGMVDEFGARAFTHSMVVYGRSMRDSGAHKEHIWSGKVYYAVKCSVPFM